MKRASCLLLAIFLVFLVLPTWADYQAGRDAFTKGDYVTALKEWRPLAENGNASAQYNLGYMYDKGYGVPQDYTEAIRWYRKVANQGNPRGQFQLGRMYAEGRGVSQDDVEAYRWFMLAARRGHKMARRQRDLVSNRMSPAQLVEAQRLAREWVAVHERDTSGSATPP